MATARWLLGVSVAACTGCGTLSFAERNELFGVVSREHSCNKSEIFIVSEETDREKGTGEYMLEACGKNRKYRLADDTFYDATADARDNVRRENSRRKIEANDFAPSEEAEDEEQPP